MAEIDLTPFGFTPTESLAYGALLELGPSSGYSLAKQLSIARANAYQALNGLVSKGAAVKTDGQPQRYRAERPDAILAMVIDIQSRKLDDLARQISEAGPPSGAAIVPLQGWRGIVNAALRTAARETGEISCLGPVDLVIALNPAWRRRAADDLPSSVWVIGDEAIELPVPLSGLVSPSRIGDFFGSGAFVLLAPDVALLAQIDNDGATGFWTSETTMLGVARAALAALTSGA